MEVSTSQATAAVIVAHQSTQGLADCVGGIKRQVTQLILVLNGPIQDREHLHINEPTLITVDNNVNLGIAKALNQGFQAARENGFSEVVALDQDSRAQPDMVEVLRATREGQDSHRRSTAIVAPFVREVLSGAEARYLVPARPVGYRRQSCLPGEARPVTIVINSGALYDLELHRVLGGFREDYFIDYVDTEYCLRARRAGYEILVACDAKLHHRWGNARQMSILGLSTRPTFHSPLRWYYISRNRIPTIRAYGLRFPHWLLFDLTMAVWWFVRMLLLEDHRLRKVRAAVLGTWDGLLGRMGPCRRTI